MTLVVIPSERNESRDPYLHPELALRRAARV